MNVRKIKLTDVIVGQRGRQDLGDIPGLAESMRKHGLLHPIVVDGNNNLVSGERRMRAAISLGWPEIYAVQKSDLDDLGKKEIELAENIKRKNLNWPEEVSMKRDLHELMLKRNAPGWTMRDTARELNDSVGTLSQDLRLAKELKCDPELRKIKNKNLAFKKVKEFHDRRSSLEDSTAATPSDITLPQEERLDLGFVVQPRMREILEAIAKEIGRCADQTPRARMALCGGLIDGALCVALGRTESEATKVFNSKEEWVRKFGKAYPLSSWSLSQQIFVAVQLGILSKDAERHTRTISDYRNLVHPQVELREGLRADSDTADAAWALTRIVVRDVANWVAKRQGEPGAEVGR